MRVPAAAEPLGIDQGLFASAARALARGEVLYRDVWDQKPPAIFLTYLLAFNVFGWTPAAIAWLDLVVSAMTTLVLLSIVRRLNGSVMGLTAAGLFAALTMPSWLYRHGGFLERSVAETFIALAVACAAWCAVAIREDRRPSLFAAGLGLFSGVAVAYKPNAGIYFVALLGWCLLYRRRDAAPARLLVAAALGAAVAPAATVIWLWSHGVLAEARVALVDFNRFYVAQGLAPAQFALDYSKAVWLRFKTDPLWAAGGVGVLMALWSLARTRRLEPVAGLGVAWGGAAALVIALNGVRLFNTYFVQALPPLAIVAAWTLAGAVAPGRPRRVAAAAALIVMAVLLGRRDYPGRVLESAEADFEQWRGRGDPMAYLERFGGYATGGGYSARANAEVAAYVRAHTAPADRIYQFGINSAGLYFAADRLMAQRFLRVNEFVPATFPAHGFDLASVAAELEERRPVYLVFEQLHTGTTMADAVDRLEQAPALEALLQSYDREIRIEDYTLYRRRASP